MSDPRFQENVSNVRFVAWDTETTGASTVSDHLVEIAALAFDEEFEHRRFEELVRPPIEIPADVIRIHGITDDAVRHAPEARIVLNRFFEFLDWAGTPRILLAHNAGFDVGMLNGEFKRLPPKSVAAVDGEIVLDTCMLAKMLLPELPSHRMEALADHFKVEKGRLHRAMADVRVLKEVFMHLLGMAADRFASQGKGLNVESLVDLAGGYFVLDPRDSEARRKPFRLPPRIAALEPLCGSQAQVAILYENGEDYRYITPVEIRVRAFKVYVDAFCHRDGIKKSFRADKILRIGKILEGESL